MPKGKSLYLPRYTVEGMEELAVVREDLHCGENHDFVILCDVY